MRLEFDRGTVVLRDPPVALDAATLPGVHWDERVSMFRAPALRHAEVREALHARGILFDDERPLVDAPLKNVAAFAPAAWRDITLRPYQEAALSGWEMANRRGLVALPTGSGKTRVALAAAARLRVPTLVLVPTRVLLEQWLSVIGGAYCGQVGCIGDGQRNISAVTVATFESAWRHMATLGGRFGLLIVDEAHHFGSGLRDEALEMSIAPARLGLSATPPRDSVAVARLTALIGPIVYELAIGDLSGGSFLASFDVVKINVDLNQAERALYEAEREIYGEAFKAYCRSHQSPTWKNFTIEAARCAAGRRAIAAFAKTRRLIGLTEQKQALVSRLLAEHRTSRVLVFTADNEAAYTIAARELIMPITCHIGRAERRDALARFGAGELRALVSAQVLNEGIDVPTADVAIVVGGARGEREHVQRVGRLLRPAVGKRACVYELVTRATCEVRQAHRRGRGLASRSTAQL